MASSIPEHSNLPAAQSNGQIRASQMTPTVEQAAALAGYTASLGKQSAVGVEICKSISGRDPKAPLPCDMIAGYAELSLLVSPITGASLVDSANADRIIKPVRYVTYFVLAIALLNVILSVSFEDLILDEEGPLWWVSRLHSYGFAVVAPFFWGALGSCVYLLKRFSDLAEDRVFDENSMKGWGTRILLGAILGGVVQFLYDSDIFTESGLKLDANALGFLSGVGVKVVYGAIEKTISALAEAMNLDAVRGTRVRENAVRAFLVTAMTAETDPDKRKVLADLIEKVGSSKT